MLICPCFMNLVIGSTQLRDLAGSAAANVVIVQEGAVNGLGGCQSIFCCFLLCRFLLFVSQRYYGARVGTPDKLDGDSILPENLPPPQAGVGDLRIFHAILIIELN